MTFVSQRLPHTGQPCIICGHPTGDCAPEGGSGLVKILPYEDPARNLDLSVTVHREVFQKVIIPGSKRPTTVRLYRVGQKISEDEAERIGLFDGEGRIVLPPGMVAGEYEHLTPDDED